MSLTTTSTSTVRYAEVRPGDVLDDLVRIHERSASVAFAHLFDAPFPRQDSIARWSAFDGRVVLACLDGRAVGFVAWRDDLLDAIYVCPDVAGHGIGSGLMARAEGTTRLWVLEANPHARAVYEHLGWRPSGVEAEEYGLRELEYVRS